MMLYVLMYNVSLMTIALDNLVMLFPVHHQTYLPLRGHLNILGNFIDQFKVSNYQTIFIYASLSSSQYHSPPFSYFKIIKLSFDMANAYVYPVHRKLLSA